MRFRNINFVLKVSPKPKLKAVRSEKRTGHEIRCPGKSLRKTSIDTPAMCAVNPPCWNRKESTDILNCHNIVELRSSESFHHTALCYVTILTFSFSKKCGPIIVQFQ